MVSGKVELAKDYTFQSGFHDNGGLDGVAEDGVAVFVFPFSIVGVYGCGCKRGQ
jgi:hypothetical protein